MFAARLAVVLAALALLASPALALDAQALFQQSGRSVVMIHRLDSDEKKTPARGTGFVVGDGSLVVTCNHVVEGAGQMKLEAWNSTLFKQVKVLARDKDHDLALLGYAGGLPALRLSGSDPQVGQEVVVIGSPMGFKHTVSTGVVSGKRKTDKDVKLLQFSNPVSPGSSGGPVLDAAGEVVGVVSLGSIFVAQNLNFAVYAGHVQELLSRSEGKNQNRPAPAGGAGLEIRKDKSGVMEILERKKN
jgi:serine protease Do